MNGINLLTWLVALSLLFCINLFAMAQVSTTITQGAKSTYSIGDKVEITIVLTTPKETCADGLNHVKLFQSGINIQKQNSWKEVKKGLWQKEIILVITGNKKGFGMLTIMRRVDKQSFTYQQRFNYSQ
jgi:hypothetical protein